MLQEIQQQPRSVWSHPCPLPHSPTPSSTMQTLRRRHTCDSVPVVDRGYVPDEYEHSLQSAGFISAFLSGSDSDHDELEPHQQHGAPYIEQQHLQEGSNDKLFASTLKLKQQGSHASHLLALQHRHSCGSRLHALGGRARRTSAFNSCSTQQMMNTSQSQVRLDLTQQSCYPFCAGLFIPTRGNLCISTDHYSHFCGVHSGRLWLCFTCLFFKWLMSV